MAKFTSILSLRWFIWQVALFLSSTLSFAQEYPFVPFSTSEILTYTDFKDELQTRLTLIEKATKSIDVIMYDTSSMDPVYAKAFLRALKLKAQSGVQIRMATTWGCDKANWGKVRGYLFKNGIPNNFKFLVFGGPDLPLKLVTNSFNQKSVFASWDVFDGIHEKMLVVDSQFFLTGGRGLDARYSNWEDTGFLLKGSLAAQARSAFDQIWESIIESKHYNLYENKKAQSPAKEPMVLPEFYVLGNSWPRELKPSFEVWNQHVKFLQKSQLEIDRPALPSESKGRILHFDFVAQMTKALQLGHTSYFDKWRDENLVDPIIEAVIAKISTATRIELVMNVGTFIPRFLQALLKRQKELRVLEKPPIKIWLNFKFGEVPSRKIPKNAFFQSIMDVKETALLAEAGVQIYGFYSGQNISKTFLHRKLAILDNTVFIGSHNLNKPSTWYNDELAVELEDQTLADNYHQILFEEAIVQRGFLVDFSELDLLSKSILPRIFSLITDRFLGAF